jgi:hypothetical protein
VAATSARDVWVVGFQDSKTLIVRVPRAQKERLGCR